MVILITGVLAVVALPRMFDRSLFDERGFFDEALNAVRYAQNSALATGCDRQVSFSTSGYVVRLRNGGCISGAFTITAGHPTRVGGFTGTAPAGISISPAVTLYFDKIGRPRDNSGTLLSATQVVNFGSLVLTIEPETGFAHES